MVEVTAAIIHSNGKLLICKRAKGKRCELLWEFPGGKIEVGETPEECLVRECHEELGITIKAEKLVKQVEYEYPDITVYIYFYLCQLIDGEPACIEHDDIQWHTLDEILNLPLCPADNKMLILSADDIRNMFI